jgi:dephospho-CoA kinase
MNLFESSYNKNQVVAITGPIASGKTLVCSLLENIGEKTISTDTLFKQVLHKPELIEFAASMFPPNVIDQQGIIQTKVVKECIKASPSLKKEWESRCHIYISQLYQQQIQNLCQNFPQNIFFVEIPLFYDIGMKTTDFLSVVSVLALKEHRQHRLKTNRRMLQDDIDFYFASQKSVSHHIKHSPLLLINNNGTSGIATHIDNLVYYFYCLKTQNAQNAENIPNY